MRSSIAWTRVAHIQPTLPEGVTIVPFYDRTDLIRSTITTVARNLVEGGLLVIVVLFLFLRNLTRRPGGGEPDPALNARCILGCGRPGFREPDVARAIDFGLLVDGAVIIVENAVRRMSERSHALGRALTPEERDELVLSSSLEVRTATAFGELIIAIVYLPILTLEGIEGKMFRPMALTVVFALAGAFVLSITLAPVLASLLLPLRAKESGGRVITPSVANCRARSTWSFVTAV